MTTVRRWLPLLWLTGIALVVGVLLAIPPARAQLDQSFTRQQTQFTELYFTTGEELAVQAPEGLTVSFVVHSHDTTRSTYLVRVGVLDGRLAQVDEIVTLEPGERRSMSLVVPQVSDRWSTIDVDLVGTADHIHWMRTTGKQEVLR